MDTNFNPEQAREFLKLVSALIYALDGLNVRSRCQLRRDKGHVFKWPPDKLFIPLGGLSHNDQSLSRLENKFEEATRKLSVLERELMLFREGSVDRAEYSRLEIERDSLILELHKRKHVHVGHSGTRSISLVGPSYISASFGIELDNKIGLPYCPYQTATELNRAHSAINHIAHRLERGTAFQLWLNERPAFTQAQVLLLGKEVELLPMVRGNREPFAQFPGLRTWFFQYMTARALLVFYRPWDFPRGVADVYPNAVTDLTSYSDKARRLSAKLIEELGPANGRKIRTLILSLSSIAEGKRFAPIKLRVEKLSITRRRALFIRELALLGVHYFRNKRSRKGRFAPDVITTLCGLIGHVQANERSINEQIQHLDNPESRRTQFPVSSMTGG